MKTIYIIAILISCSFSCYKCINLNFEEQRQQFIKNFSFDKGSHCMKEVIQNFMSIISDDQITSNIKLTTHNGIDENLKAKIAIQLTNCHFDRSSRPTIECNDSMKIKECTLDLLSKDQKGDYWSSYTLFYTHIDNLFFYYKSEGWQQNTEFLIDSLYLASEQLKNEITLYNNSFTFGTTMYYSIMVIVGFICGLSSQTKNARQLILFLTVINFCAELYISNMGISMKDQNIFKQSNKIEINKVKFSKYIATPMWKYTNAPINKMMMNNQKDQEQQSSSIKIIKTKRRMNMIDSSDNNCHNQEEYDDSSSELYNKIDEFDESDFSKCNQIGSNTHVRIENEGYLQDANDCDVINSSSINDSSRSMQYLRVVGEDDTHMDNIELPSENDKTETDTLNCLSIPDEVDSEHNENVEDDYRSSDSQSRNQRATNEFIKQSNTIELSKKGESVGINSIFCSESASSKSNSKQFDNDKDYIEICKELNDMAVELIKQGIQIQEGEDEEGEGEEYEQEKMIKAYECYQQAKSYLNACIKHSLNNYQHFEDTSIITIHYNLACVYQKIPELDECSKHLDIVLKMIESLTPTNSISELNKLRFMAKFHLQQCAIKSQLDNNIEALEDGKMSVKNCHSLISKTFTLCKSKIKKDLKIKFQNKQRMSCK